MKTEMLDRIVEQNAFGERLEEGWRRAHTFLQEDSNHSIEVPAGRSLVRQVGSRSGGRGRAGGKGEVQDRWRFFHR